MLILTTNMSVEALECSLECLFEDFHKILILKYDYDKKHIIYLLSFKDNRY